MDTQTDERKVTLVLLSGLLRIGEALIVVDSIDGNENRWVADVAIPDIGTTGDLMSFGKTPSEAVENLVKKAEKIVASYNPTLCKSLLEASPEERRRAIGRSVFMTRLLHTKES